MRKLLRYLRFKRTESVVEVFNERIRFKLMSPVEDIPSDNETTGETSETGQHEGTNHDSIQPIEHTARDARKGEFDCGEKVGCKRGNCSGETACENRDPKPAMNINQNSGSGSRRDNRRNCVKYWVHNFLVLGFWFLIGFSLGCSGLRFLSREQRRHLLK